MREQALEPFGLLVQATEDGTSLPAIDPERIHNWLALHRIVVFRGFEPFGAGEMSKFCAELGEPLRWEFGLVNELRVKANTENYLFTNRAVPLHWDGAFVGKIPHYIFFECVRAPAPGVGGETTFCDTTRVLAGASDETIARWSRVHVTYETEKLAHYGGEFTASVVNTHPHSAERVLRYAEPVADLNPVSLEVEGADDTEFIAEMRSVLYDPNVLYAHRWRDGDVVIADNHALLHGRREFSGRPDRHLRRINILAPSAGNRWTDFVLDNLRIRRFEYFIAEIPIIALPLLVSLTSPEFFGTSIFWIGIAVFFLLFNFGDMINCVADRDLDKIYKPHLSRAVYRLGVRFVWAQIVASASGAIALTAYLSWATGLWMLVPLVVVGIGLGAAYSVEPVRLKARGMLQPICLWTIIFVGPMLFMAALAGRGLALPVVILAAAYATIQIGVILFNTAEDFPEDREAGVVTSIVWLGIHRGVRLALRLAAAGGIGTLAILALLYDARGVPPLGHMALLAPAAAYGWVIWSMARVSRKASREPENQAALTVKKAGPLVPIWVTSVAWSSFAAALVLFILGR